MQKSTHSCCSPYSFSHSYFKLFCVRVKSFITIKNFELKKLDIEQYILHSKLCNIHIINHSTLLNYRITSINLINTTHLYCIIDICGRTILLLLFNKASISAGWTSARHIYVAVCSLFYLLRANESSLPTTVTNKSTHVKTSNELLHGSIWRYANYG